MSIRNRIFAVFALSTALGVYGLFHWMQSDLLPRYMEAQEDLLVDMAHILAAQIEAQNARADQAELALSLGNWEQVFAAAQAKEFSAQIYDLLKTQVELRVMVTDATGRVVFDSDNGRDLGRDNSRWHDVKRTLEGGYGARSTHGDPLFPEGSTMYIGAPIRHQGDIVGVVSVGKTTRNAERFLDSAIRRLALAAALVTLAALLLARLLYWWVSRPLEQLHQYAQALQGGERLSPPELGQNEIGRVADAMAELRQALDGKSYVEQYVQSLTHELKSPTTAIAGAAELLHENMPAEDARRLLGNVQRESQRLRSLIERMLELAEIENQATLDDPQPVPLVALIHEAAESVGARVQQKGLTIEVPTKSDAAVPGDAFLLHRALVNLLDNAIDFSPAGGLIQIRLAPAAMTAAIVVADQGSGIPDYARPHLFHRFYSLARDDGSKGTGLGLSFVRQVAALHGGSIELDQGSEGGVSARLTLPTLG